MERKVVESKVTFYSDGLKIAGMLFEPENAKDKSCIGLVMCQGRAGRKEYYWYPHMARKFVDIDCVVLAFDYRGIGESEGPRGKMYPLELVEDVRSALTYLEVHPKVDPERLALFGLSLGGALAPYVAGIDQRVKCSIAGTGYGDGERRFRSERRHGEWLNLLERIGQDRKARVLSGKPEPPKPGDDPIEPASANPKSQRIIGKIPGMEKYESPAYTLAALEKIMEFKPIEVVDRISPRAIMYIAAERDPNDSLLDMYQRTRDPKKLWLIRGIGHYKVFEEPLLSQLIETCQQWLWQHAGPRA